MTKDSKAYYLEDDIQKVQIKTNLYINEYGNEGAFHLAREVIQNNFDECMDPDSNGSNIEITYDKSTDILTCEDDSRGFPEKDFPLYIYCTKLQSGSKFFREGGGDSAGEFGVGLTVVNALSDRFTISSFREAEKTVHTLEFKDGVLEKDNTKPLKKTGKQHGSLISFKVSTKYMGEGARIPINDVIDWVDSLFYLDTVALKKNGIKCTLRIYDGLSLEESVKFKPKPFEELLDRLSDKKNCSSTMSVNGDREFTEDSKVLEMIDGKSVVKRKKMKKHVHLDIAIRYDTSLSECIYDTYCNNTNTIDNGTHKDIVEQVFCRYIQSKANETLTEKQKEKMKATWEDIKSGLIAVINLSTNGEVGFVGNAKRAINAETLVPYITEVAKNTITEYFENNQSVLNEYIKIVKLNAKARIEAQKTKSATQIERLNNFKSHEMKNFIPCVNTGKKFKELFIVEGNSAGSGVRNASDPMYQAIFLLRGVPANAFKHTLPELMENKEWKDLVTVLRCGIGPDIDVSKLYFDRINIFTDEDVDGFNISASVLAGFYRYMRPIIEAGKLYKVSSPLYQLNDKEHPFVANKSEMVKIYHKKITKSYKIRSEISDGFFTKEEFKEFLMDTYDYNTELNLLAKDSGKIDKMFVEAAIAFLIILGNIENDYEIDKVDTLITEQKFITKYMSVLQKLYPEIILKGSVLSGIVNGKFVSLKLGHRFLHKAEFSFPIFRKYGYWLRVKESGKDSSKERKMSIAQFLDECTKLTPEILHRFKGLSEINPSDLNKTTMDINNRVSVQYTIEDVEKELAMFKMTHGTSSEDARNRKEMMKAYKIRREDLDN